jgi:hypothetical protein
MAIATQETTTVKRNDLDQPVVVEDKRDYKTAHAESVAANAEVVKAERALAAAHLVAGRLANSAVEIGVRESTIRHEKAKADHDASVKEFEARAVANVKSAPKVEEVKKTVVVEEVKK